MFVSNVLGGKFSMIFSFSAATAAPVGWTPFSSWRHTSPLVKSILSIMPWKTSQIPILQISREWKIGLTGPVRERLPETVPGTSESYGNLQRPCWLHHHSKSLAVKDSSLLLHTFQIICLWSRSRSGGVRSHRVHRRRIPSFPFVIATRCLPQVATNPGFNPADDHWTKSRFTRILRGGSEA